MRYLREVKELNQVERWKLERHPLDVRDAVVDRYAREGPEAIKTVPGEVERLKWVGLYPQRQGGDAFMLRIKVPGGRLDAAPARVHGAAGHFLDATSAASRSTNVASGTSRSTSLPRGLTPTVRCSTSLSPTTST